MPRKYNYKSIFNYFKYDKIVCEKSLYLSKKHLDLVYAEFQQAWNHLERTIKILGRKTKVLFGETTS